MRCNRGVLALSAASLLALRSFAADEPSKIYECTDAKGNVVYQGEPCPEPGPPVAAPAPTPKPPAKTARPRAAQTAKPAPTMYIVEPAYPSKTSHPAPPPRPTGPVDPRWATPQAAVKTFVAAVKAGDRALVVACLTPSALDGLGHGADALPLEALRATVDSFTGYVSEGDLGPYWSIRALRAGARPKWIFLERTGAGEWRIGGF